MKILNITNTDKSRLEKLSKYGRALKLHSIKKPPDGDSCGTFLNLFFSNQDVNDENAQLFINKLSIFHTYTYIPVNNFCCAKAQMFVFCKKNENNFSKVPNFSKGF